MPLMSSIVIDINKEKDLKMWFPCSNNKPPVVSCKKKKLSSSYDYLYAEFLL